MVENVLQKHCLQTGAPSSNNSRIKGKRRFCTGVKPAGSAYLKGK